MKGKGFKLIIENSLFGQTEMEYLYLWVARSSIIHKNRNIKAIANINPPNSQK